MGRETGRMSRGTPGGAERVVRVDKLGVFQVGGLECPLGHAREVPALAEAYTRQFLIPCSNACCLCLGNWHEQQHE